MSEPRTKRWMPIVLAIVLMASLASMARASAETRSVELATLTDCTETFASLAELSLATTACGDEILVIGGRGGADPQPGPWDDNDDDDVFQQLLVENRHADVAFTLTNSRRLANRLEASSIPVVMTRRLAFADCTAAACTGQRVSASWRTAEGPSSFTLSLSQPLGGVQTPSHRHDHVWWSGADWLWVEHGAAQEFGGSAEFTGSGYAAEEAGGGREYGMGFVQRQMTTVLHGPRR